MALVFVVALATMIVRPGYISAQLGRFFCGGWHEVYQTPEELLGTLTSRLRDTDRCGVSRLYPVIWFDPLAHVEVRRFKTDGPLTYQPLGDGVFELADRSGRRAIVLIRYWPESGQPLSPPHYHLDRLTVLSR